MSTTRIPSDQVPPFQVSKDAADPSEHVQFLAHVGNQYLDHIVSTLKSPKSRRRKDKKPHGIPTTSMEILRNHASKLSRANENKIEEESNPLSTNHIIEMAAVNFIQSKSDKLSPLTHPYASTILGLSNDEDGRLVQGILSCAEKVSNHHYLSASRILAECHDLSFRRTSVVKRLVYHFARALSEKIDRETGRFTGKNTTKKSIPLEPTTPTSALASFHQKIPLHQITLFASIQEMVHHVSSCKRVHIIDLEMRCGLQQVILMQALTARPESPLKHLKITGVAINSSLMIEEAGARLRALAKSLNLDFSFHAIKLEDIINLHPNTPHRNPEEKCIVYASQALKFLIAKPSQLEALMGVIKRLNPCAMIVCEPEGNLNSPVFVNRFVEALFYYGAYFDCLADCMTNDSERMFVESNLFSPLLRATVAAEGEERRSRIVGINVWREFFAKFGMVERELSKLALDHASMILNMFECRSSCTLCLNGNGLVVRWKGTPITSLSVWKFQRMHKFRI